MNRLAALVLLLIFTSASAVSTAADDPARNERLRERLKSGVLRWGGDAEGGAPYQLRDPQDPARVIGFEVEIADAVVATIGKQLKLPLKAQFVQYEWVSLEQGLNDTKDFDLILSGYERNEDNKDRLRFSRPYCYYGLQLVVRANDNAIQTLADCVNRPVATMAGTASERTVQQAGVKNIVTFAGQVEPFFDLELGRVDAVLLDLPVVTFYSAPNPRLKSVGPPIAPGAYLGALRRNDLDLAAAVDDALSAIMIDGTLRDILRKWHLWDADQARLAEGPKQADELRGLGFNAQGVAVDESTLPPVQTVDRNMIAASGEAWTFDRYAPVLLGGAAMTVLLTVLSMSLAMTLGLFVAICRLYAPKPVPMLALGYVEFFRGIPQLLVLYFIYYGLPSIGIDVPAFYAAIIGFGLVYAAYESEIYRSAIESVPRGQWEAARALGMTETTAFHRVVFPQAFRTALGPMTNDFVAMFKDTSLVSVIAVSELTKEYLILSRSSFKFVELGILTAVLYLAMSVPLGYLSRYLEQRWGPKR